MVFNKKLHDALLNSNLVQILLPQEMEDGRKDFWQGKFIKFFKVLGWCILKEGWELSR